MTAAEPQPLRCATHPEVETYLRCGRCGRPICPRCLVQTPVGARCRDCARPQRLPTFELGAPGYLKLVPVGLGAVILAGVAWAVVLPLSLRLGLLGILAGAAIGYLVGEAVTLAFNRKRATLLAVTAGLSVVLGFLMSPGFRSWFVQLQAGRGVDLLAPLGSVLPTLLGLLLNPLALVGVVLATVVAVSRVR
ncbi:MAG: hypothetical protein C4315_07855 [Chloroflexota bacterium]